MPEKKLLETRMRFGWHCHKNGVSAGVRYITHQAWNLNGGGRCERAARWLSSRVLNEFAANSALKETRFELAVTTQPKECGWRADVLCRRHRVEKGTRLSRLRYRDNTELRVKVNDREIKGMEMRGIRGYVVAALLALALFTSYAPAKGTNSTDVIIQLRLAGDVAALPLIRSCLAKKLSQMPDVKVATASTEGARFVVDIVAAKNTNKKMSASLVVAEIFPMEQFQPRMKEGENAEALLTSIRYYTLLRMHEVIPARSDEALCLSIAADIGDQVLSKEYTERND